MQECDTVKLCVCFQTALEPERKSVWDFFSVLSASYQEYKIDSIWMVYDCATPKYLKQGLL